MLVVCIQVHTAPQPLPLLTDTYRPGQLYTRTFLPLRLSGGAFIRFPQNTVDRDLGETSTLLVAIPYTHTWPVSPTDGNYLRS